MTYSVLAWRKARRLGAVLLTAALFAALALTGKTDKADKTDETDETENHDPWGHGPLAPG